MSAFMETVTALVKTVSVALAGPVIPAVIAIGKDVIKLIDEAKDVVDLTDVAALNTLRDELEPKVMAHADKTEADLRG